MIAVLAGGTGLVGGECLRLLLEEPRYQRVLALTRRPLTVHHKLAQTAADFPDLAGLSPEIAGGDVFCCLGTTIGKAGSPEAFRRVDRDFPVALARKCAALGARRFLLVSSLGADPDSRLLYSRVKGECERDVAALPFEAVVLLRPALLLGRRAESRPAEAFAQAVLPALSSALVGPLRRYRPVEASAVARAMLRLAGEALSGVRVVESDELLS